MCLSVLEGGEKGSLPVVATVFDKLNQVYKEYLEAEQTYTVVSDVLSEHHKSGLRIFTSTYVFVRVIFLCLRCLCFLCLQAMESGPSRGSAAQKRPVRTQAVIDQSDMYTHVLSSFTERKVHTHTRTQKLNL